MERGGFVNRTDYLAFCRGIPGTVVDQPFQDDFVSTIARHADTGKWFAAILRHDGRDFVNLKCDPVEADFLRGAYAGITPAYHMNKTHWITVYFDSDVPDDLLRSLTMSSLRLTGVRGRRLTQR